ncbi:hypothetical protein PIROE2DRAFT_68489 [Piromyces sp. E2]|nr:hypothetical protein PIROE2DRAFT_68489 [Piromyces sp. E2]|eukprot:OUM69764.1 hypothetical protein PIROE2DRAFT_68489 [Piromyces sp. E2]
MYYCINGNGEIYSMGTGCNSVQLGKGVYVFDVKTQASDVVKVDDLATYSTPDSDGDNLAMYSCDSEGVCRPISGYVKLRKGYYKVQTGTSSEAVGDLINVSTCENNVGKLGNLDPTATRRKRAGEVDVICVDGEDANAIPLGDAVGNSYLIDTNAEFGSSSTLVAKFSEIGNIISVVTVDDTSNYLIKKDGKTVIYDSNTGEVNSDYMDFFYNYCVDDDMRVWKRKDDLCHQGTDGGYYLYVTSDSESKTPVKSDASGGPYTLVQCTNSASSVWSCGAPKSSVIGIVPNAFADGEYIKCEKDGNCTPEATMDSELGDLGLGVHMIDISAEGLLGISTASNTFVNVIKTASTVLVDTASEGYYSVTSKAVTSSTYRDSYAVDNTKAGDLYNCSVVEDISKCVKVTTEKPIGGTCTPIAPGGSDYCNADNRYGDLYVNAGGKTVLCNVKNAGSELILAGDGNDSGEFMASISSYGLFGISAEASHNIVLNFDGQGNVSVDNTQVRYRYTLTTSTKIQSRVGAAALNGPEADQICKKDGDNYPQAREYILADWVSGGTFEENVAYYVDETYTEA